MNDILPNNENTQLSQPSGTLTINHQSGKKFINMKDVIFLKANNVYTNIHLADESKIFTAIPLYKFEEMLDMNWFFRIHKSHILNILHFKEYSSKNGHYAIMKNGEKLLISKYRLKNFIDFLQSRKDGLSFS